MPMLFWPTKSRSGVFPGGLVTCGSLKRAASRMSRSRRRDCYPELVAKHPKCSPSHRASPSAAPRVVPTSSAHKLTGEPARHLWRGLGCGSGGDLWQEISPQSPHSAPAKSEWRAPEDFVKSRSHLPDGLYAPVVLPPTLHDGPGLPPARKHMRGAHLEHIQLQRAGPRVLIARRSTRAGADRRCQSERSKARARGAQHLCPACRGEPTAG